MEQVLDTAYSKLGLKEPFIAAVMTRVKREISDKVPTAATDGACVWYNPAFMSEQSPAKLFGLVLHESLHVVLMHMWRRGDREPELWNYANDAIINAYVLSRGYELPDGGVYVAWVTDSMSSEYVYRRMKQERDEEEKDGQGEGGEGGEGGEPKKNAGGFDGKGDLIDAPNDAGKADLEATIAASAQMAKDCGHGSAIIDSILNTTGKSTVDWGTELRALMSSAAANDYTYQRPSRRFIGQGLYLPSLHSEALGGVLFGIDSSGSMTQGELSQIATEATQIIEDLQPLFVEVVYCDTRIQNVERFEKGDEVVFHCKGGGGTDFKPVFDHLANMDDPVVGLIYFTDMEAPINKDMEPHVPVIWAHTGTGTYKPPFGVVANVEV